MTFSEQLLAWYHQHGRQDLPWRQTISPYRVWLSEIMLQQTQVKTVLEYFQRFIETFPTVVDLANANPDRVMHLWSGLGYYTRARNLHKAAKMIRDDYQGHFPFTIEQLQTLPGVGRSTAAAIFSISYDKPAAILDGNVKRVLSRYFALQGWPGTTENSRFLWSKAEALLPNKQGNDYTQAIMDLGAIVCKRSQPDCKNCPVSKNCLAYHKGLTNRIPASKPQKTKPVKTTNMLIIKNKKGNIFLQQRPPVGIWGGLWCLPMCDLDTDISEFCQNELGALVQNLQFQKTFRHSFSHYHLDIHPIEAEVLESSIAITREAVAEIWYDVNNPSKIGLAAPVTKLLQAKKEV